MKHIKIFEDDHKLPSAYQPMDLVAVDFGEAGKLVNCRVAEVHFTESDVSYDLEVMVHNDDGSDTTVVTTIRDVDASFVKRYEIKGLKI
jgi:hypothetical protein